MGFIDYLKETRTELKHVSWATRKQAVNFTALVIGVSLVTALLLGAFDMFFDFGLRQILPEAPAGQVSTTTPQTATSTATSTNTN